MSEPSKVSVVLPCYNAHEFLGRALESVRSQTFQDLEIVVVDDGSTDPETIAYLDALPPDVRLIRQKNKGLPGARNSGFDAAVGNLVLPLDCDDWIEPNFLEEALAVFEQYPNLSFVFSHLALEGEKSGVLKKEFNAFEQLFFNQLPYCLLIRKSVWEAVGGYDESMRSGYEDWEFNIRLSNHGHLGKAVRKPLFHYTVSASGMLQSVSRAKHGQLWRDVQSRNHNAYRPAELFRSWLTWRRSSSTHLLAFLPIILLLNHALPGAMFTALLSRFWWLASSERNTEPREPSQRMVNVVWLVLFGSVLASFIAPIGSGEGTNVSLYDFTIPVLLASLAIAGYIPRPPRSLLLAGGGLILLLWTHSILFWGFGVIPYPLAWLKGAVKLTETIAYVAALSLIFRNAAFLRPSASAVIGILVVAAFATVGLRSLEVLRLFSTVETISASILAAAFVALVLSRRTLEHGKTDWLTVFVGVLTTVVCAYGVSKTFALVTLLVTGFLIFVPIAQRMKLPAVSSVVGGVAVLAAAIYGTIALQGIGNQFWVITGKVSHSFDVRWLLWDHAWTLVIDSFPWGIGLGQFVGDGFYRATDLSIYRYVHNTPLGLLTELGAVGAMLFVSAATILFQALRQWPWTQRISVAVLLGTAMLFHDVQGMRALHIVAGMTIGYALTTRVRPITDVSALALISAVVSRFGLYLVLIATARMLPANEFGVFVLVFTVMAIVNAVVSGGGDMWLNRFGNRSATESLKAPLIWKTYLGLTLAIGVLTLVLGAAGSYLLEPIEGRSSTLFLGIVCAVAAGSAEALLATLRSANRVAFFFKLRDIASPIALLFVVLAIRPDSADQILWIYLAVWASVAGLAVGRMQVGRLTLPKVRWHGRAVIPAVTHTAGLIYGNVGSRLANYLDILVLAAFVSLTEIGNYRVASQIAIGFMVVQHFVFLGLPWQLARRGPESQQPSKIAAVRRRQVFLLGAAVIALAVIVASDKILLGLFGQRFVAMAPVLDLMLLVRFTSLLWGPQHELLVSQNLVIKDAHANVVTVVAWIAAFLVLRLTVSPLGAAVAATALAQLAGNGIRYGIQRSNGVDPVFGHPFGVYLPVMLTVGLAVGAAYVL